MRAAHAGEPRGAPRRGEHVGAHAEPRADVGLLHRLVHGRRRFVGLDDAVAVVEPALAARCASSSCSSALAACSARSTGAAARALAGVAAARNSQSQRSRAALGRGRDVEGARAVEHPAQALAQRAGRGQGHDVARHQQAAVGVGPADRRADLGLLLDERDRRPVRGQGLGGARPLRARRPPRGRRSAAHLVSSVGDSTRRARRMRPGASRPRVAPMLTRF